MRSGGGSIGGGRDIRSRRRGEVGRGLLGGRRREKGMGVFGLVLAFGDSEAF